MSQIKDFYLRNKAVLLSLVKWLFLILFVIIVIKLIDFNEFKSTLASIRFSTVAVFTLLLGISKILYAVRWKLINSVITPESMIPWKTFLSTNLLAEFVSIALPTSISGEVVRYAKINPLNKDGWKTSIGIFIDRLMGVATMLAGSIILVLVMEDEIRKYFSNQIPIINWPLVIILSSVVLAIFIFFAIKFLRNKNQIGDLDVFLKEANQKWPLIVGAILISFLSHFSFSVSHLVIFDQLNPLPLIPALGVVLIPQLAKSIPISLFGISGSEGLMIFGQMLVGLPENTAIAITFISLFARYFYAALGLIIELIHDGWAFLKTQQEKPIPKKELSEE